MSEQPKSRDEYEKSPPTDKDYTGPRFEYAFSSKPYSPYFSKASCPNGAIYGTFKRGATSMHGSIQYPFELTPQEVRGYQLIDYQRTKEQLAAAEKPFKLSDYEVPPLPSLYKFQITGYENSHPDTYMLGLGTIDDQNHFTGAIKHQDSDKNLREPAEYNVGSSTIYAWEYTSNSDEYGYYTALATKLPITNITLINQNTEQQGAVMSEQLITDADIVNIFRSNEQQVYHKVGDTERNVVANIDKLEYFKGYAKGMNGLIDKVQANASLEIVIAEVQMLTNQFNLVDKLGDYSPSYPNTHETPPFLQGQIKGITEGVQTLRGIDITKYIENAPTQSKQNIPEYPALTKEEREEHTAFVGVMLKNYPTADIENLNKLCGIASEMTKHSVNNANGVLSSEKFNTLTDLQEVQIAKLVKDLPGLKYNLDYEPRGAAIKFELPQGQTNNMGGYAVPEINSNKLAPKKTNEIVSPFSNNQSKGQTR